MHRNVAFSSLNTALVSVTLLVIASFCHLSFGAANVSLADILKVFSGTAEPHSTLIILHIRLPRLLLAIVIGACMATCGAVTQGLFRNPLADPSLIGVSAGASAGASIFIAIAGVLQLKWLGLSLVSIGAFSGGMIAVWFVYRIATGASGTSVATMLLAGIAVNFLAASITNLLAYFGDSEMLRRISLWQMGSLDAANYSSVILMFLVSVVLFIAFPLLAKSLNALLLGESEARHLGIPVDRIKTLIVTCVALGVGASVAVAGTIAFVGLIVPHIGRMLLGPNHHRLIPFCAFFGATLVVISDTLAKLVVAPAELPIGLITSLIGAPIFIVLLKHRHQYGMQA